MDLILLRRMLRTETRGAGRALPGERGEWQMAVSNYFRALAVAAGLAALMVVTVMTAGPAKAAFPGTNGKIAFDSSPRAKQIRRSSP